MSQPTGSFKFFRRHDGVGDVQNSNCFINYWLKHPSPHEVSGSYPVNSLTKYEDRQYLHYNYFIFYRGDIYLLYILQENVHYVSECMKKESKKMFLYFVFAKHHSCVSLCIQVSTIHSTEADLEYRFNKMNIIFLTGDTH